MWVGWTKAPVRRLMALLQLLTGGAGFCAVPTGMTVDPCSLVTGGLISCSYSTPDLNPGDWAGWFGCQIGTFFVQDLPAYASYIWSAISSYVSNLLAAAFSEIENALNSAVQLVLVLPIDALLNILTLAVNFLVSAVSNFLTSVDGVLAGIFGPFAPVAAITLFLLVLLALIVGAYYLSVVAWAVGKTLFNLL